MQYQLWALIVPSGQCLQRTTEMKAENFIIVFRHGESEDNRNRVFSGWRDSPLTEIGCEQARALAPVTGASRRSAPPLPGRPERPARTEPEGACRPASAARRKEAIHRGVDRRGPVGACPRTAGCTPRATVTLRVHKLVWRRDLQAPALTLFGVLVTRKVGPFTLRREYVAPEG